VVSFGWDLAAMAPPGLPIERWDDIPAISEEFHGARDMLIAHLPQLLAAGQDLPPAAALQQEVNRHGGRLLGRHILGYIGRAFGGWRMLDS
jgi:hypothetical protein